MEAGGLTGKTLSPLTILIGMVSLQAVLCAVISECHEAQGLVGVQIADAMDAPALCEDHASRLHLHLADVVLGQTENLYRAERILASVCQLGVIPVAHVGDSFAFEDVIKLLASDVLVCALDRTRRNCHLVKVHD